MKNALANLERLAVDTSTKIVNSGAEELMPVFIGYSPKNGIKLIATPYGNEAEKDAAVAFIKEKFKEEQITAYVHVAEAWMLRGDMREGIPEVAPSKSERREEIIMVVGEDADGNRAFRTLPIIRDENNVRSVGKEISTNDANGFVDGRFVGLLPD